MPWLSARKLYTKAEMMRALLRAGQFAHLTEEDISSSLDELHDTQFRYSRTITQYKFDRMNDCVPELLLSLSRKHALEPFFKPHVCWYLNDKYGCLCAMCFDVTNAPHRQTSESVRDSIFWTPTMYGFADFDFVTQAERKGRMQFFYEFPDPWCHSCASAVYNSKPYKEFRKMLWNCSYNIPRRVEEVEALWATLKAVPFCIQNKPHFVQRLSKHRDRKVRFDPRRKLAA